MIDPDDERLPLPSEDSGDLHETPPSGMTDDPLVAQEEGVPWDPPSDRVMSESRLDVGGPDVAGTAPTAAGELERQDAVQAPSGAMPRDDELQANVIAALRDSDLPAGERLKVAADGTTVWLRGEVESVTVLEEILGLVGDVPGVEDVRDEVTVTGL